jgi:hypothetical protein
MSNEQGVVDAENPQDTTGNAGEENDKTFTKSEVEKIVQGRLAKFGDYEQVKQERDELKRTIESGEAATAAVEQAKKEVTETLTAHYNKQIVQAEAKALAAEMGFFYPNDAHLYIDLNDIKTTDEGVDLDSLKAQLEKVAQERPALVRSEKELTAQDLGLGRNGPAPKKTVAQIFAETVGG